MFRRTHVRFVAVLIVLALSFAAVSLHAQDNKRGRKYKSPPATSRIDVTVLRDSSGKPIEAASVVFHPLDEDGKDAGSMELRTNEDGKTYIDVIETNTTVRVQVIAQGFKTYGQDYRIDKPQVALEIRMKRPGEQYSIYKPHPDQNQQPNPDKKPDTPKPQQ